MLLKLLGVLIFLELACCGCATTSKATTVVKACEPTTVQETQLLTASSNTDELVALALIDALQFPVCVVQKLADGYISTHQAPPAVADAGSIAADLAQSNSVDAIRLRNLMDWRAEHP